MPIEVTRLTEADIQGAITTIQLAFADDPYNLWVYDDRSKVTCHFQSQNFRIQISFVFYAKSISRGSFDIAVYFSLTILYSFKDQQSDSP